MPNIENFTEIFEGMLLDDGHGYSQVDRWGKYGDYDCSSAIVAALQQAGFDTGAASWTGNMAAELCARGWTRLDPSAEKERGDILLNEACHVAVYLGCGTLGEFSCDENGGIDGAPGDQTGREAYAHGYYDYPWDCVLRFGGDGSPSGGAAGAADTLFFPTAGAPESITYQAYTAEDGWLPPVTDLSDYAGIPSHPIRYLAVDFHGHGWLRAYTEGNGWLPPVSAFNPADLENGCAGDGTPIRAIQAYYETPDPAATGYWAACYRVAPLGAAYYPWQQDDATGPDMDGYAGNLANAIDRVQFCLTAA